MSYRYWVAAIALGVALSCAISPVYSQQDETTGGQEQTASGYRPADDATSAVPIHIVEDEGKAEARQRSEERAEQRELDDLAAQQGMNEATQKMAVYSVYQTILVGIGTAFLHATLVLSAQANKAASLAAKAALDTVAVTREVGIAQTRSYISVATGGYILNKTGFNGWVDVLNSGASAAIDPKIEATIALEPAWFGGSFIGARPDQLDARPFIAKKANIQPGETSRFYFHWTKGDLAERFESLSNEKYTIVISVRLDSKTIYKGITDSGAWQLTNYPGFVRVTERSRVAEGALHPRQLQRS